jgi:hypothetical protein
MENALVPRLEFSDIKGHRVHLWSAMEIKMVATGRDETATPSIFE